MALAARRAGSALLRTPVHRWCAVAAAGVRGYHASAASLRGSKNLDWYFNAVKEAEEAKGAAEEPVMPAQTLHGRKRARAFIDLQFGRDGAEAPAPVSRVVIELADDLVPLTVQNFLSLCERPAGKGYRGSELFMVRKGFGIMAGDWILNNGRGGASAFAGGKPFADENFIVRHSAPGVLTMANSGVHSNTSVFMITAAAMPHLDGRNVAFGRVLTGLDVITKASTTFAVNLKPATPIVIKDAGRLPESEWAAVDKAIAAAAGTGAAKAASAGGKQAPAAGKGDKAGAKPAAAA